MIFISGLVIHQLYNTTFPPNYIIQGINLLIYSKSNIDVWNISANIIVGNFDHVVVEYNSVPNLNDESDF